MTESGAAHTVDTAACAADTRRRILRTYDEALRHVQAICFKTGPPRLVGAELEWTVHHRADHHRPVDPTVLRAALGPHAPPALDPASPHHRLPHGGTLTVEPGGQVELSTPPQASLATLHDATSADLDILRTRLARVGLVLGNRATDPYRPPRQMLHTPRYGAMVAAFARGGGAGRVMMCSTAATQVCLDAGESGHLVTRWRALHTLGPALVALFATGGRQAGADTGWASARMRAWLAIDPARTAPVESHDRGTHGATSRGRGTHGADAHDPATAWARYALAAPLLCVRRGEGGPWRAPPGMTFAAWIAGAYQPPPTVDDLEYHLGTLFPPVRPRGHLEVRYLDAQPPDDWFTPVAVVAALLSRPHTTAAAVSAAAPVAGAWVTAARKGLADPRLRRAAAAVAAVACDALPDSGLDAAVHQRVAATLDRRLDTTKEAP